MTNSIIRIFKWKSLEGQNGLSEGTIQVAKQQGKNRGKKKRQVNFKGEGFFCFVFDFGFKQRNQGKEVYV